ncbi:MAG: fumarylacetoacetase [Actinomycetota bacterium]|jgi:fumarylacetoacetase|nr:fumarylacetoacetase [Actinomycetota bacterium]
MSTAAARQPASLDRRSWVPVAEGSDFPLANLPYCVFHRDGQTPRVGVAIGEQVLDLAEVARAGLFDDVVDGGVELFGADRLNPFMARGRHTWDAVRFRLSDLLDAADHRVRDIDGLAQRALVAVDQVHLQLPFDVADYVDFYASMEHATNLGRMFRPDGEPLLPNWKHLPVGYHGRTGTVVPSGTPIVRPSGQHKPPQSQTPTFGPSRMLDFEAEVGFVVGSGSRLGSPVAAADAADHVFGLVLVNDWSARDIQAWEYQPLGPFLGKSFATSVSPWVVPLAALAPYRLPPPVQDPPVLEYLRVADDWALDLELEVRLGSAAMASVSSPPVVVSRPPFAGMYWTVPQMVAHTTVNGASLRTGDLFASGTVSGVSPDTVGSLIELTKGGREPLTLPDGSTRAFLEDGDSVEIAAACARPGRPRIGFGAVTGTVLPAHGG